MDPTNAGTSLTNPTMSLKTVDQSSIPEIDVLSEMDFRNFVYTGISAIVDLPLNKTTRNALFGVNIDGFIPPWNVKDPYFASWFKNFYPVQNFPETFASVKIRQEVSSIPVQLLYLSHRIIAGNVGVGVRLTANTAQSGNLIIAQASGVTRHYYANDAPHIGLIFTNSSHAPIDYNYNSFLLGDVSLNRNISITPIRKDPTIQTDLARKLIMPSQPRSRDFDRLVGSQYQEDWLLFGILSNLPSTSANQLTFSFFFDYSQVQFYQPMLVTLPTIPTSFDRQIMLVSDTWLVGPAFTHESSRFLGDPEATTTSRSIFCPTKSIENKLEAVVIEDI